MPFTTDDTDWLVLVCSALELELLLISDQGIVIDADDPLIEGMVVVTSTGLKLTDLVVTPAKNSSAGEVVTLELVVGAIVDSKLLPSCCPTEDVEPSGAN